MEGVMIRGVRGVALAVRSPGGDVIRRTLPLPGWSQSRSRQLPLLRGLPILVEMLMLGFKTLNISARIAAGEDADDRGDAASQAAMGFIFLVSMAIGVGLFFLLPLYLSRLVENAGAVGILANLTEGGVRLGIFLLYLLGIGMLRDIRRVFGYHGAEHMTIAAMEAGASLDVESVRRFEKEHPRCGTSFLLTIVVVSVLVFSFVPRDPVWLLVSSRIFLLPVIAVVSYELIRLAGSRPDSSWVRVLVAPNLLLQKLTTRVPDDSMIEVAIDAMRLVLQLDEVEEEEKILPVVEEAETLDVQLPPSSLSRATAPSRPMSCATN